nr:retron Ec78 anti-phage system effector HNH endonuclease PtuB [uncultured Moellerella sp.]
MRKLDRSNPPECLKHLNIARNDWKLVNKAAVWDALDEMQNGFCAYCECSLERKHIEHFRTRDDFAHLTFDWTNLFGSCGDSSKIGGWLRCGIYKDNGAGRYDPNNLIKPDVENPSLYLHFLTTGSVRPCVVLTATEQLKATETIRVFNLNGDSALLGRRRQAINAELHEIEVFYGMQDIFSEDEWNKLLQDELSRVKDIEFSTALTHVWRYNNRY